MKSFLVGPRCLLLFSLLIPAMFACNDSTSPNARQQNRIFSIKVSAHAAPADTIRISFSSGPANGCSTDEIVSSQVMNGGIRFSVTSVPKECLNLPIALAIVPPVQYLVPPPHPAPYTVYFAEPDAADSVRVIPAQ